MNSVQNISTSTTAEELAKSVENLFVFPDTASAILTMLDDESSSSANISDLVRQDIALSVTLLRMSNSAQYFQGGGEIDNVETALGRVGLTQLKELVYGIAIPRATTGMDNDVVTLRDFWKHSLYTATLSFALAGSVRKVSAQTAFTAGLIHDIGQLAMFYCHPAESKLAASNAVMSDREMCVTEQEIFGFTHEDVGLALGQQWELPMNLVECISGHHRNDLDTEKEALVCIVHVANILADSLETEQDPEESVMSLSEEIRNLVLPESLDLADVFENANHQYDEMQSSIIPTQTN